MVQTCCVKGCVIAPGKDVTYYRFPSDADLKKQWKVLTQVSRLTAATKICSQHFVENDYKELRGRKQLRHDVVPSVFEGYDTITETSNQNNTDDDKENSRLSDKAASDSDSSEKSRKSVKSSRNSVFDTESDDEPIAKIIKYNDRTNDDKPNDDLISTVCNGVNKNDYIRNGDGSKSDEDRNNDNNLDKIDEVASRNDDSTVKDELSNKNSSLTDNNEDTTTNNDESRNKNGDLDSGNDNFAEFSKINNENDNSVKENDKTDSGTDVLKENISKSTKAPDSKVEDIEEILTNYQIRQDNKNIHSICEDIEDPMDVADFGPPNPVDPVFIEIAVGQKGGEESGGRDCLMVLESVQCEVDPSMLLHREPEDAENEDDDDVLPVETSKEAISLLTSSDEDEVIIQEPHIDTVEVSDETDEDDVPLVKLVKVDPKPSPKKIKYTVNDIAWGGHDYYCAHCHYTTRKKSDHKRHMLIHNKISPPKITEVALHMCKHCSYTTASKNQLVRHLKMHKDEKKFQCQLCDYRARHKMSLIYHMKCHKNDSVTPSVDVEKNLDFYKCDKCSFSTNVRKKIFKHMYLCGNKIKTYKCNRCSYESKWSKDVKRHKRTIHSNSSDEEYIP